MTDPLTVALAGIAADKAADLLGDAIDAAAMAIEAGLNREEVVERVKAEIRSGLPLSKVPEFIVQLRDEALARIGKKV